MSEQGSHSKTSIKCYILKNGEQEVIQSFHLKFSYANARAEKFTSKHCDVEIVFRSS